MRIALIGGRDQQQFPTLSYGGIETCVENLAWGLHKNGNDFVCLVPKREQALDYPFEIVESSVPPMPGPESQVWPFANSLPELVRKINPDIIWSQSFWSADTLQDMGIPIICTFHDILKEGARPNPNWFQWRSNTWYRFISKYQYDAWVDPQVSWQRDRCFQLYTGLADDEYDFGHPSQRKGYYLWVGGFSWGWHGKGLDIFTELARRNPEKKFVAFGTGNREIEATLKKLEHQLSNFDFPGQLHRGQEHRDVFKKAKLYVMPTQIPDTFPRTVLESISKGTPVLGTKNGALPEMIGKRGGFTANSFEEMEDILNCELDYNSCFDYARKFSIDEELTNLISVSENLLQAKSKIFSSASISSNKHEFKPNIQSFSLSDQKFRIATIINFCTIDYKFIRHCIRGVLPFSKTIVVPYADRLFNNTCENQELIEIAKNENPEANFQEFKYHHSITEKIGAHFWHNFARWVGVTSLPADIDFVLFLDADEIVETERFSEFIHITNFSRYNFLFFANYWYFRKPIYRAQNIEISPVMVKKAVINRDIVFLSNERGNFSNLPNGLRGVLGMDNKPMIHHYSWVRSRQEMLSKVQSWAHKSDRDWVSLVKEEFSHDFDGTDFVHGYQYDLVEPYINLESGQNSHQSRQVYPSPYNINPKLRPDFSPD